MKQAKPIQIDDELAARYEGTGQFERFDSAVRKILSVPHSEIVRRDEEYKRQSALNPKRRGPKPKARASR